MTIPNSGTMMRKVYDRMHAHWHSALCATEFPLCDEWAETWANGHEFTGEDLQLAVIEAFEAIYETSDDIPMPELELVEEEAPLSTMSTGTSLSGGSFTWAGHHRTGDIVGFAGDGRIVHIKMDHGDEFEGADKTTLSSTGAYREVTMVVDPV